MQPLAHDNGSFSRIRREQVLGDHNDFLVRDNSRQLFLRFQRAILLELLDNMGFLRDPLHTHIMKRRHLKPNLCLLIGRISSA